MQLFKKMSVIFLSMYCASASFATEFDQYLQTEQLIDAKFKIKNNKQLNDLLKVLTAEDSRTLPLQIDQDTVIEQLKLSSNKTELTGLIITPDFAQFEQSLGRDEVKKILQRNLIKSCGIFFEHQYQRANPYSIHLNLSSTTTQYQVELKQKDCAL